MTQEEVLGHLNDTPHYFYSLGVGLVIRELVDGVELRVERNKAEGGINVSSGGKTFHFYWDLEGKWGLQKPMLSKA